MGPPPPPKLNRLTDKHEWKHNEYLNNFSATVNIDKNTSQRTLNQQDTDNCNSTTQCDALLHVIIKKILPEETHIHQKEL